MNTRVYQSPLNFTGAKHKLIPVLLEHFPKDVDIFYDVFAGGLSVSINCEYDNIVANDIVTPLIDFYEIIQRTGNVEDLIQMVRNTAIPKTDRKMYNQVRNDFNSTQNPYLFFALVASCTNNMMRFNKKLKFNQSFGKRTVTESMIKKLRDYHRIIQKKNIIFTNYDYKQFLTTMVNIGPRDFVYLDPPYLMTEPRYWVYWSWEDDLELCSMLNMLDHKNIRFVMSNVRVHKDKENPILDKLKNFTIVDIEHDYEKVARKKGEETIEMIVKNF